MKRAIDRFVASGRPTVLVAVLVAAVFLPAASGAAAPPSTSGRHIVLLDDSVRDPKAVAAEHARRYGADVDYVYEHAVKGYAASFRGTGAADVARDHRVRLVEPDRTVSISTTQTAPPWGLDRIDEGIRLLDGSFTYRATGADVTAYVIDTGIRTSHEDFEGRAKAGSDGFDAFGGNGQDCNGHGTHVAGTIGGKMYGVAKGVTLVAVRVLDCNGSGSWSGVMAGIDWVTGQHTQGTPAVANMSLGGSASSAVDAAVRRSVADGVAYAVAAGNGNVAGKAQDACKSSPARVAEAMTIGATDSGDRKASWSNYGNCVDWFAPGVGILSAGLASDIATDTFSGTSMAAPHTAGVAALYLEAKPGTSPPDLRTALYNLATQRIVTSAKTANNHLLFTDL